jgi:peptide/nickel transport system permease protein
METESMSQTVMQPEAPSGVAPQPVATPRPHVQIETLRATWRLLIHNPLGVLGLSLIALFAVMAVSHPILMATVWNRGTYHPLTGFDHSLVPHPTLPSARHVLGTDALGRDVLSQLLYATGPSFGLGLVAGLVAVSVATAVGVTAAYYGGLVDACLMGVTDAFVLMPPQIVLLVVGLLVDMDWPVLGVLYGLFAGLGGIAVIMRSQALSIKVKPYIEAARVAGGSHAYIIRTHFLPNLVPLMLLNVMFTVAGAVLTEALLSFFGRTQIRLSWGTMIWFIRETFRLSATGEQWHAIIPPGLALMLFCGAFYMVGRALDDVLNPRLRKR